MREQASCKAAWRSTAPGRMAAPMLVMSGESVGYGEGGFDPGPQWYRNLNIVGGPQRLVEPIVKVALQPTSVETLYHSVVRAGEIAQRTPRGPTYLCVSMEAMIAEWSRPETMRAAAPAPASRPSADDIAKVAAELARSRSPFILVERAGSDQETFDALVDLAELLAIPVIDAPGACAVEFSEVARSLSRTGHEPVSGGDGLCSPRRERGALVSAEQHAEERDDRRARTQPAQGYDGLSGHRRSALSRGRPGADASPAGRSAARSEDRCRRGRRAPDSLEGRAREAPPAARCRRTEGR